MLAFLGHQLLGAVPQEHRKLEPNLAWLLVIPVFALVWNFFVWPKVSESYASFFQAHGRPEIGNANSSLAWAACICLAIAILPYIGWFCLSWAGLVVMIIYLVKMFGLRREALAMTKLPPA